MSFLNLNYPIYLDYNASAPVDPAVLETMLPVLKNDFANPSSIYHIYGRRCADIVQTAREQTASALGCTPNELIFTSGATESCNLAIKGVAGAYADRGNHIVAAHTEHKAVLEPLKQLAKSGFEVALVRPERSGAICPETVEQALTPKTILVCLMAANNVFGTINPIEKVGRLCKKRGILFFCDATQALGKMPFSLKDLPIDLAAFSSHKAYGPKGVGALYVRRSAPRVRVEPQIVGGGQEQMLRAGTENVAGIVGFAKAAQLARLLAAEDIQRISLLKKRLEVGLLNAIDGAEIVAAASERLCNTTMIVLPRAPAQSLLREIGDRLCVSTGSACDSASSESGYVLRALGLEQDQILNAVRFSLGRFTSATDIDAAIHIVAAGWAKCAGI